MYLVQLRLAGWNVQVNLDRLVGDVLDVCSQMVKPSVTLDKHIEPSTPKITGDKKRLTQILHNLVRLVLVDRKTFAECVLWQHLAALSVC